MGQNSLRVRVSHLKYSLRFFLLAAKKKTIASEYMKDHIFELRRKIGRHD